MCLFAVIVSLNIHRTICIYNNSRISVHRRYYVIFLIPPPLHATRFCHLCCLNSSSSTTLNDQVTSKFTIRSSTIRHSPLHIQQLLAYFNKEKGQVECLGLYQKRASHFVSISVQRYPVCNALSIVCRTNMSRCKRLNGSLNLFCSDQIF